MDTNKLSEYSTVTSNLESLHQSLNQGTQSIENDANAFQTSNNINTSSGSISCATTTLSHTSHVSKMVCTGSSEDPKKCIELQSNNSVMDTDAMSTRLPKSSCCETLSTSSLNITSPVTATTSTGATLQSDLTREHWYAHAHAHAHRHPHHTSHHPGTHHPQQLEELVMYAPATTPSISKFGLDSSTESYLNARYNVNVKGVCHERTSSFFDIPAVTHPYCYRFPSPPAGILKKSDDETSAFCNNSQPTSATSLPIGHHYHSSKIEHPDSTTTHLSHHHHHHHSHSHNSSQFNNLHQSAYSSAFKFSHSGVISTSATTAYHHYNSQVAAGYHNLRPAGELSPTLTPLPVPTSTDGEMKYDGSPYNPTISSTYALRPTGVEADTVTSTEADVKFENLYSSNAISTSQTVNQRRGSLQLWQFLVALLDEPTTSASCIAWTGRGMEFKLIEPEEVARRWGIQKNRPAMNYDKLSRSLRYYYEKGIMQKVNGERYVYRFVCDPDALFNMAYGHLTGGTSKGEHENMISVSKSMIGVSDSLLRSNMGSTPTTVDQEIHRDRVLSGSLSNNNSSLKSSDAFFYETAQKF